MTWVGPYACPGNRVWWLLFRGAGIPREGEAGVFADADPDREFAERACRDSDAFAVLYDRYYVRVLNLLNRRVRCRDIAEDLTAQVFTAAWRGLQSGAPRAPFRPWIFRIALKAWLSYERRSTRWRRISGLLADWLPRSTGARATQKLALEDIATAAREELMQLPPRYREPVILRIDDGMEYADIAATLGISPSGARTRVARGLGILRRRLGLGAGEEIVP
jgi:RNA polymerase sigma-70 factor (ECF subfamily)